MVQVVYQDEYLLVVDKPPGLVVAPTETQAEPTLADILRDDFGITVERGGIVHRLDKDTSGLLLVAKTPEILEKLQAQFKERTVQKEYICLVHGWLMEPGVVDGSIGRNPGDREKFVVMEEGREARTRYAPIQRYVLPQARIEEFFEEYNKIQRRKLDRSEYGKLTLVECKPETGRTHQIRVHLKHIGFPIAGDQKYGGRKTTRLDHRWLKRQFLHAAKLEFTHPVSGERVKLESPLPEDLVEVLSLLEKV